VQIKICTASTAPVGIVSCVNICNCTNYRQMLVRIKGICIYMYNLGLQMDMEGTIKLGEFRYANDSVAGRPTHTIRLGVRRATK
jgi:hypothetical protein